MATEAVGEGWWKRVHDGARTKFTHLWYVY